MKKIIMKNSMKVAAAGMALMMGSAMADPAPVSASLEDAIGDNASGGGAWLMDVFSDALGSNLLYDDILTFCVELDETISIGGTLYGIDSVASYATDGGVGAVGGQDPLDKRTAWLYEKIIDGETSYGSVSYSNVEDAYDDAQYAFWVIEQEMNLSEVTTDDGHRDNVNAMIQAAADAVGTGDYAGSNVVVYNLVTVEDDGSVIQRQSMLGWKDDTGGGNQIPEPATLFLLGGGLLGLAGMRRRRRNG